MKFLVWRASRELGAFTEAEFRAGIFSGKIRPTDVFCSEPASGFKSVSEYRAGMVLPPPLPTTAPTQVTGVPFDWRELVRTGLIIAGAVIALTVSGLGLTQCFKRVEEAERTDRIAAKREAADQAAEIEAAIAAKKIKLGMTKKQCLAAWGYPERVNRTVTKNGAHEQWVYGETYVYFDNGRLTSWQD